MKTLAGLLLLLAAAPALAQVPAVPRSPAFVVDRLAPAPGAGLFFQVEGGEVAPHGGTSFGLVTSFLSRPIVMYSLMDDRELSRPVASRLGVDVLASVGLLGRFQLGLAMPIVVFQDGDRLGGLGLPAESDREPLATSTQGDLRLHGKVRLLAPRGDTGLSVAGDLIVSLPTGDEEHFAGEAGTVVEARLAASWRGPRAGLAVNLGPRLRTEEVPFLDPTLVHSHELAWGVAGGARLPWWSGRAWAVAELAGAWGLDPGDGRESPDPVEARAGVRLSVDRAWSVAFGAGGGLGSRDAVGAPAWRALADLRYTPVISR